MSSPKKITIAIMDEEKFKLPMWTVKSMTSGECVHIKSYHSDVSPSRKFETKTFVNKPVSEHKKDKKEKLSIVYEDCMIEEVD